MFTLQNFKAFINNGCCVESLKDFKLNIIFNGWNNFQKSKFIFLHNVYLFFYRYLFFFELNGDYNDCVPIFFNLLNRRLIYCATVISIVLNLQSRFSELALRWIYSNNVLVGLCFNVGVYTRGTIVSTRGRL
jgi:hypothetical protein